MHANNLDNSFQSDSENANRPARVKKIKSYEEEDLYEPHTQPLKKKKKGTENSSKSKKISFGDVKHLSYHNDEITQQSSNSNIKRPRGRPPLIGNKAKPIFKDTTPVRSNVTPKSPATINQKPTASPAATTSQVKHAPIYSAPVVQTSIEADQQKVVRPSAAVVATRVLAKLMTSDPLSVTDLLKNQPEASRDLIQTILDTFVVMGVVVSLKGKDTAVVDSNEVVATTSNNSGANALINYYAMTGFAKSHSAVQLTALAADTAMRVQKAAEVRARNEQLHQLTQRDMSASERTAALKLLIDGFLEKSPELWDEPLYRSIIAFTGNTFPLGKQTAR